METIVFGIKNCDTMKRAFAWLDANAVAYRFHDYRRSGVDTATLQRWCAKTGHWEALVNKRGTTWRKLSPDQQAIADAPAAIALMQAQPSLIRRPVIECRSATGDVVELLIGLDPDLYARVLRQE